MESTWSGGENSYTATSGWSSQTSVDQGNSWSLSREMTFIDGGWQTTQLTDVGQAQVEVSYEGLGEQTLQGEWEWSWGSRSVNLSQTEETQESFSSYFNRDLSGPPPSEEWEYLSGTTSWGSTGSGLRTVSTTGSIAVTEIDDYDPEEPPSTFSLTATYQGDLSDSYDFTSEWMQTGWDAPTGSAVNTYSGSFTWSGTHDESWDGGGWSFSDGNSHSWSGTNSGGGESSVAGLPGYDASTLGEGIVGSYAMPGAGGVSVPSAPQSLSFSLPPSSAGEGGGGQQTEPPGGWENPYWEGFKGFVHGFFITGGKAVVNETIGTVVGFATLGTYDVGDVIPVDPNTDLGYEGARIAASIGVNAAFIASTAGLSCTSRLGQVVNGMQVGGGGVQIGEGLGDMVENGLTLGNVAQTGMGLLSVVTGTVFRNCFPAGTPVSTEAGPRPIETVRAGERVWAYNLVSGEWTLRPVLETYKFLNDEFVQIQAAGEKIVSTAGHPFWVVQGEDIEDRPRPEHISAAEQELRDRHSALPGRWVDAGALLPGDVLFLRDERRVRINSVELFRERQLTYNFAVDDLHCYAIGEHGVLVHNNCSANAKQLRKNMGSSINSSEEAHHIVASGHRRAADARKILSDHGVGINDAVNGVALSKAMHHGRGLHSYKSIDAVTKRLRKAIAGHEYGSQEAADAIKSQLLSLQHKIQNGYVPGVGYI